MLRYTRPRIAQTKRRDRQMPRHLVVQLLIYVKNVQHKLLKDKTESLGRGRSIFLIRIRIRPTLGSHPGHGLAKFGLTGQMND